MGQELTIAIKMANTADALVARVREARKGPFTTPSNARLFADIGIDPMLLALAMELALKAWITLDQGSKIIREHNLSKLFDMLQPEQQEKIESDFRIACPWYNQSYLNPLGKDVASILDHHADAFVKWRYMHEMTHGSFSSSDMENVIESVLRLFRARYTSQTLTRNSAS
ncbi:hypothetical protein [Puniceibacterium sediminis]|uniref:HEPN domain-containing protein n=1 Tax=Puniceibacterium sediminis TaxID=1608407 RepID=A0A238VIJ1_9RHOB|nr:hypothetical protein [Puniceibacterium sediminis]SNR34210.1 hypothetical protein SAMN06265370_102239 [Puniceibacterium sediminis]